MRHLDSTTPVPPPPGSLGATGPSIHRSSLILSGRDDRELRRAGARGELVRVAPGSWVTAAAWASATPEARHALVVQATVARLGSDVVVSHRSALAVQGFPLLSPLPSRVHVVDRSRSRTQTSSLLVRHAARLRVDEIVDVDGVATVTPLRAGVDLARSAPLGEALIVLDHGLRTRAFSVDDLVLACPPPSSRGGRRAAFAISLADAGAESAGESLSRSVMATMQLPAPVLQHEFWDRWGFIGRVDFWWPCCGVVGEFDGRGKYLELARRTGRTTDRVVLDEKEREDRLRALPEVKGFARWGWAAANDPFRLVRVLADAGVRP